MTRGPANRTLRAAAFAALEGLLLIAALVISQSEKAGVVDWYMNACLAVVVAVSMFFLHRQNMLIGPAILWIVFFAIWAIQQSATSLRAEGFAMLALAAAANLLLYVVLAGKESGPWMWANLHFGKTIIIEIGDRITGVTDISGERLFEVANEMIVLGDGRRMKVLGVGAAGQEPLAEECSVSGARRVVLTSASETEPNLENLWQAFLLYCHARSMRGLSILVQLFTATYVVSRVGDSQIHGTIRAAIRKARIFEHGEPNQRMHTTRGKAARV